MKKIKEYKTIFDRYGGIMKTEELQKENILYRPLQKIMEQGLVEKVRYGYYQWVASNDFSEAGMITRLFPDAIVCMDTALRYYNYSDRIPLAWHLAVSRDSGKSRFDMEYPFIKPHYVHPAWLEMGLTHVVMEGHTVRMYDKERVICDCLRFRHKMDKEMFNKAVQSYVADPGKNISSLLKYAEVLRVKKPVTELIGVWL